ncbi:unnamed protein product [Mytilus coruscus]|uniref:MULE transposase domain-containing protein n=1 Tax=Mytilus coruscus TaxID=42192 RepID=A0A6J8BHT2_MYTCO|nr:unnamed protein product [Mytilus coruscus]
MEDPRSGVIFNEMFVQYYFDSFTGPTKIEPHGNSTKAKNPYQRTSHSTFAKIKEFRENKTKPKEIFNNIISEQGGLEHVKGSSSIPRNRKQIYNVNNNNCRFIDPVVECTDLAKEQEKNMSQFVRDVRTAPEFSMFLGSDRQLTEIGKFCAQNKNFCVLGVDTTFNIGNYYVTVSVYRHQMLLNRFDTEPVMIGPMLIHQRKSFDSYFKLPSTLLQESPKLIDLKVFGTDGDVNLSSAFQACFPNSKHLLCDIHMFDNIERKLVKLGISGKLKKEYINDIFGYVEEDIKIPG